MNRTIITRFIFAVSILLGPSCDDDFLERAPLDAPSMETFWGTPQHARMWVNNLYLGLPGLGPGETLFEAYSDNGVARAGAGANLISRGIHEPNDEDVRAEWDYTYIRLSLEFFQNIGKVSDLAQSELDELSGQVRFMLAYKYFRLITLFRDVPLVTQPLNVNTSDIPKSPKAEVLEYILEQLDLAIEELPVTWPASENGRVTKGAALALKARVLLYNERWAEAAAAAKAVMDLNIYELHPKFDELFRAAFNNKTKEVILARQYAETANTHEQNAMYGPGGVFRGQGIILPTAELEASFEMIDGLPIDESPMFDPANPFADRDPRYYHTFLYHGADFNGTPVDITADYNSALTYIYFRKYIQDFVGGFRPGFVNFTIFRYADVLLMYAEAKNEASGPDDSVYDALDLIRDRAGMPPVDRVRYSDKASLREAIRNERRVELAGEGLRYFDIIRWRIAEQTMNKVLTSMNPEQWSNRPLYVGVPIATRVVETRVFDPAKHYVWPIPQDAVDRAKKLAQHDEW